jgi:hypothetical protein
MRDYNRRFTISERFTRREKMSGATWKLPGEETAGKVIFRLVAATCLGALAVMGAASIADIGL